jgi:hypothetical protein
VFVGADITYDPVLIKDVCAALLLMMKALGRAIDVYITATARTQVLQPLPPPPPTPTSHRVSHPPPCAQAVFQTLMECAAQSGFDIQELDIAGRLRLFRVDDGLVKQLKLCVRHEVLNA